MKILQTNYLYDSANVNYVLFSSYGTILKQNNQNKELTQRFFKGSAIPMDWSACTSAIYMYKPGPKA